MHIAVYTPGSRLRDPIRLLADMAVDLLHARTLAWQLFLRNVKSSYRSSYLGAAWSLLPAMAMALICTAAGRSHAIAFASTNVPYPAFVILSMMLWQVFVESLNAPIQGLAKESAALTTIKFPPEAVVLAKILEVIFNALIKLAFVAVVFAWFKLPVTLSIWLAPLAACSLIVLGTFIGALITPISMFFDDFVKLLYIGTAYWFLITPIIYPTPHGGVFSALVFANPVTPLLVTTRELATGATLSCAPAFALVSLVSIVGLTLSWVFFKLAMPFVIERK